MQSIDFAASWLRPAPVMPTAGTDAADPIGSSRRTIVTYVPMAGAAQRTVIRDKAAEHRAVANVGIEEGAATDGAAENTAFTRAGKLAAGYGLRPRGNP